MLGAPALLAAYALFSHVWVTCSSDQAVHPVVDRFLQQIPLASVNHADVRPKICIYDLPRDLAKHGDISDSFYGLDQYFPDLLKASPYWTNNTNLCDYFYVNAWLYWDRWGAEQLVDKLRSMGPFWDKKGGADHIFVVTHDPGRCELKHHLYRKVIFIQHYGKLYDRDYMSTKPGTAGCDVNLQWGSECDDTMKLAEALLLKRDETHWCHLPGQDIVVPSIHFEPKNSTDKQHTWQFKTPFIHKELQGINRTHLLFYSGKVDLHEPHADYLDKPWTDSSYSLGARQTIYRMFANTSGFYILNKHSHQSYWELLASSHYCLATTGWGWGGRFKVAVTRGCVPLVLGDGVKVEYEDILPIHQWALKIPMFMAHKMHLILAQQMRTGRTARMQAIIADCTWRLHWWRREEGRAFEVVMCELKRRLLGVPKVKLDVQKCALDCGDGRWVMLKEGYNNV